MKTVARIRCALILSAMLIAFVACESSLNEIKSALLSQFDSLDIDNSNGLSFAEAKNGRSDLTESQFESLDANGDNTLSRAELGAPTPREDTAVITISYSLQTLDVGSTEQFEATSTDARDKSFAWSSGDETIALVSDTGLVLGVSSGTTTIRAVGKASGGRGSVEATFVSPNASLPLWNGELGWSGSSGTLDTSRPFRGSACFEGYPGMNRPAQVNLKEYPSLNANISSYEEIWLFAATSEAGDSFRVTLYGNGFASNSVFIEDYVEGGVLDPNWRLARIPIADLVTEEFRLEKVGQLAFDPDAATEGHSVFVDEVWAVGAEALDSDDVPLLGPVKDIQFGNVAVHSSAKRRLTLSNIGSATLTIKKAAISGLHKDEFAVEPGPFTIEPGASRKIQVEFAPKAVLTKATGDKTATLLLVHDYTPLGSSLAVSLFGRAVSPAISVSRDALDFGAVADGSSAMRSLVVSNPGNGTLHVSSVSTTHPSFVATPSSFDLAPDADQTVSVTFTSSTATSLREELAISSNAVDSELVTVDLEATGLSAAGTGALPVDTENVTSSNITLTWPKLSNVDLVKVYLSPEPFISGSAPPAAQILLDTLPGNATTYTASDLAPSVDAFFQVIALDDQGVVMAQGTAHGRTVGGPRAELDGVARQVCLVAPSILCVVLTNEHVHSFSEGADSHDQGIDEIVGETGAEFQAGPWTVTRANGDSINVTAVHRLTSPIGEYYYEAGYGNRTWNNFVDVDHELYLVLDEPVGSPEVLTVTGPTVDYEFMTQDFQRISRQAAVGFVLPFSDRYLETLAIQVNQVGYSPRAKERYAYVSGWMGDGGPLPLNGMPATAEVLIEPVDAFEPRQSTLTGLPIALRSPLDESAGTEVRQIDLANLPAAEGTVYRVRVPEVGVSWPTQVSETAVFKAFYTVARGLFHNRWAGELRPDLTEWSRPTDHVVAFAGENDDPWTFFPRDTPLTDPFFLAGGHHDAGDFDIRPFHGLVGEVLLNAFESNASVFTDGQLTIPESGNGIPDLLDEALWSLAAWEQLQEVSGENQGGIRMGVESWSHPGIYFANEDPLPYFTLSVNAIHTARVAGLFAQASRLVEPYDQTKADELLNRAIAAYDYAVAAGIDETAGGPILYAAGELYRVTGEPRYREMASQAWDSNYVGWGIWDREIPYTAPSVDNPQPIVPDHIVGILGSQEPILGLYDAYIADFGRIVERDPVEAYHAFRNGRPPTIMPNWGKGTTVGQYLRTLYAARQLLDLSKKEKQMLLNKISLSADYVLGCNPLGRCWITGLGSRPPQDPLHTDSLAFMAEGMPPIPGIPVYGPVPEVPSHGNAIYSVRLAYPAYPERPLMRRYADVHYVVRCSEFTVWETQIEQTRLFSQLLDHPLAPPESWLPGGTEHRNPRAPRESATANQ